MRFVSNCKTNVHFYPTQTTQEIGKQTHVKKKKTSIILNKAENLNVKVNVMIYRYTHNSKKRKRKKKRNKEKQTSTVNQLGWMHC